MLHGIALILKGVAAFSLAGYLVSLGDEVGFGWQEAVPFVLIGVLLVGLGVYCIRVAIRDEVRPEIAEYEAALYRPLGDPGD